jgi:Dolichyl-phosphate-mannose-protein mannosyltransferase
VEDAAAPPAAPAGLSAAAAPPGLPGRRVAVLASAALALFQLALLAHTAWDKSDTGDEPTYLAAAAMLANHRDFAFNCEAPALPKWGFALALRLADPRFADTPAESDRAMAHVLWSRPLEVLRRNLFAARMATALMTALGGLFLFSACSRFGLESGLSAQALWCVSPALLANGALATLDAWAAALLAAALLAAVRVVESPGLRRAAVLGATLGLAAATKATTLAAVPVALAVVTWAVVRQSRRLGRPAVPAVARSAAAFALAGALALWAVYGFRLGEVDTRAFAAVYGWPSAPFGPAPFAEWIQGLLTQAALGARGHRTYLFGEVRQHGWWWFYLAVLAIKTTLGAQALAASRFASWRRRRPSRPSLLVDLALLAYPVLLLATLSVGRTQTGVRYALPLYPFLMAWAGRAVPDLRRAFGAKGAAFAAACLVASAAESLAVHPHHLMFYSAWAGGPAKGPRYLIVGDDWGQDQRRLGEWQSAGGVPALFYAPYSGVPQKWGIRFTEVPCTPRRGIYALQAVEVHRPRRIDEGCLDWLTVEPPDDRIGYSIYIYYVNKERLERLVAERGRIEPFWRSGPPAEPAPSPSP